MAYSGAKAVLARKSAFTLIELLVVIVIIALLAALIFPVFSRVREKGRSTTCSSNIRQVAMAIRMYTDDHEGCFPFPFYEAPQGRVSWRTQIYPRVKSQEVFRCPSAPEGRCTFWGFMDIPPGMVGTPGNSRTAFGINWNLFCCPDYYPERIIDSSINRPDTTILVAEMSGVEPAVGHRRVEGYKGFSAGWVNGPVTVHNGGANYAFCDGHLEWLRPEETYIPIDKWDWFND